MVVQKKSVHIEMQWIRPNDPSPNLKLLLSLTESEITINPMLKSRGQKALSSVTNILYLALTIEWSLFWAPRLLASSTSITLPVKAIENPLLLLSSLKQWKILQPSTNETLLPPPLRLALD